MGSQNRLEPLLSDPLVISVFIFPLGKLSVHDCVHVCVFAHVHLYVKGLLVLISVEYYAEIGKDKGVATSYSPPGLNERFMKYRCVAIDILHVYCIHEVQVCCY